MKLYDAGKAPNPRRVRIFLAEKGIALPETVQVDMMAGEHRLPAFLSLNPWHKMPVLVLDDGTPLAESIAICRYFEELHPQPALFGTGAQGRAIVEMWNRRVELGLLAAAAAVFRHLHPAAATLEVPQVREWGLANKDKVLDELRLLDQRLAEVPFIAGADFSVADISAGVGIDFLRPSKVDVPADLGNLHRWHTALRARPSWNA